MDCVNTIGVLVDISPPNYDDSKHEWTDVDG
jgi:hypothetical protein